MRVALLVAALSLLLLPAAPAAAASLRVAPVTLDLGAARAGTIALSNGGARPLNVQVRVFRWRQESGGERLEPATDVVASPPATTLAPGADYLVRVVRTGPPPGPREESYRLIVDELPDPAGRRAGTVAFVLRHSIPVFFGAPGGAPALAWRIQRTPAAYLVEASNAGTRRARIADLRLADGRGRVAAADGLLGYVLPGATMRWQVPARGPSLDGAITIGAQDTDGAIHATAPLAPPR